MCQNQAEDQCQHQRCLGPHFCLRELLKDYITFNFDLSIAFHSTMTPTLVGVMSDEVDEVGRRIIEEEKFFAVSIRESLNLF